MPCSHNIGNIQEETAIHSPTMPEMKLMLALLASAIKDLIKENVDPLDRQSAIRWIFGEENNYVFSFETVCLHLDIDPIRLRKRIRNTFDTPRTTCYRNQPPLNYE
ncbi:MAG TPA: hypothetical protein EYP21_07460 [Syntrophaceae bacterium]|nr:hypothetical protein [Syntrophaceae bacterium]